MSKAGQSSDITPCRVKAGGLLLASGILLATSGGIAYASTPRSVANGTPELLAPQKSADARGPILRASTTSIGEESDGNSSDPAFSPGGGSIAFTSAAVNLTQESLAPRKRVFVKVLSGGDVFLGSPDIPEDAIFPVFAPDGAAIAYSVPEEPYGCRLEVRTFPKSPTDPGTIIPIPSSECGSGVFSPSGQSVAYVDHVTHQLTARDLATGKVTILSTSKAGKAGNGESSHPAYFSDGRRIAFSSTSSNLAVDDTNSVLDVFVKDLKSGKISLVSKSASGVPGNFSSGAPSPSRDGVWVAFASDAYNLIDGERNTPGDFLRSEIYVKNLKSGAIIRVSSKSLRSVRGGSGSSTDPEFSPDGTRIVFSSFAQDIVPGDTNSSSDIFMWNMATRRVTRVSTTADGRAGDSDSWEPTFSPDGRQIAFISDASNLVPGDTNGFVDVFVKDIP